MSANMDNASEKPVKRGTMLQYKCLEQGDKPNKVLWLLWFTLSPADGIDGQFAFLFYLFSRCLSQQLSAVAHPRRMGRAGHALPYTQHLTASLRLSKAYVC